MVIRLEDDFEALETGWVMAGGGFVDLFVAVVAFFVDGGDLRLVVIADGLATDEVEAVVLELTIEFDGRQRGTRSGERGVGGNMFATIERRRLWLWVQGGWRQLGPPEAPGVYAADDLGDAALGEAVLFRQRGLAHSGDPVIEVDLEIARGRVGEATGLAHGGIEGEGHDGAPGN